MARDIELMEDSLYEHKLQTDPRVRVDGHPPPIKTVPDYMQSQETPATSLKDSRPWLFGSTDQAADTESMHKSLHSGKVPEGSSLLLISSEPDRVTIEAQRLFATSTSVNPGSQCLSSGSFQPITPRKEN
ncbi:uncharacterized protein BO95DRAFT_490347 [Aspergillus brunneoviolaceus CBS 621.78]|uniref:Uncharacterized protein n=1 Tax=Aspergillus brunneoviolaceus CBS 621.78 TaxID=1450534 RepID=A0ACD1FRM2_9EURO|nr:hypothetical protein BO95DRAFT_490347 [Aspergillus brunneoviolaceus CBS 621.78]RAH39622.1 hypothetical protein BO95DRAFT_490347 [Aspergillus brunneoviolaceus CBS 621.78]